MKCPSSEQQLYGWAPGERCVNPFCGLMKDYSSRLAVAERRRLSSVSEQDERPCLPLKVHERAADYAQLKSRGQQMDRILHLVSQHFVTDSHSRVEIHAAVTQGHITQLVSVWLKTQICCVKKCLKYTDKKYKSALQWDDISGSSETGSICSVGWSHGSDQLRYRFWDQLIFIFTNMTTVWPGEQGADGDQD